MVGIGFTCLRSSQKYIQSTMATNVMARFLKVTKQTNGPRDFVLASITTPVIVLAINRPFECRKDVPERFVCDSVDSYGQGGGQGYSHKHSQIRDVKQRWLTQKLAIFSKEKLSDKQKDTIGIVDVNTFSC